MAASICSDVFTVTVVINIDCTLTIPPASKTQEVDGHGTHTFTIPFTYIVGTEPDTSHANFGFLLEPASPAGYPTGVTVTGVFANSGAVDTTGAANGIKSSSVEVTVVIAMSITENFSFDVRVELNTGV